MGDYIKRISISYMSSSNVAWQADIRCYDSHQYGRPEVAYLRFFANPAQIPADALVGSPPVPVVNLPLARFADVVSMLRHGTLLDVSRYGYSAPGDVHVVNAFGVTSMEFLDRSPMAAALESAEP